MITRKDALVRDDIVAARVQRNEGAEKKGHTRRDGAAILGAGRHAQQFAIVRGKPINFEFEKARRGRTCPCKAIQQKYSVVLNYSK